MDGISPTSGKPRKVRFNEEHTVYIIPNEEPIGIDPKVIKIDGAPFVARRGVFSNLQPGSYQVPLKGVGAENVGQDVVQNVVKSDIGNDLGKKTEAGMGTNSVSYADKVHSGMPTGKVNFRYLEPVDTQPGVDVVLTRESVKTVQLKLACTLYGYFLGDRIAFPVVEHYVTVHWKKFGLMKTMMNANGFFFFKFENQKGMLDVLEGGPWLIRGKPIFLNTWSPTTNLKKEDVNKAAVWVKMHDIPLAAYSDDGLSLLATKIGSPRMLDTYTSAMCSDAWGRSSYARALIDISANQELKDVISVAIPDLDGDAFVTETIRVEYEWKPPRCATCCVFGHDSGTCPKRQITKQEPKPVATVKEDGFIEVKGRKTAKKPGIQVNVQKPKFEYRPLDYKKMVGAKFTSAKPKIVAKTQNSFSALDDIVEGETANKGKSKVTIEELEDASIGVMATKGASTSLSSSNG